MTVKRPRWSSAGRSVRALQAEPRINPRMTAEQVLERWPDIPGPPGVLTADEIETLVLDLIDELAARPTEEHDELAASAATWWCSKYRAAGIYLNKFVDQIEARPGLIAALETVNDRRAALLFAHIDLAPLAPLVAAQQQRADRHA